MTRRLLAVGACLLVSVACARDDRTAALENPATVLDGENLVHPRSVIVEGCLTASGDRFMLTELTRGTRFRGAAGDGQPVSLAGTTNRPTTEIYRLVGMDDELRPLTGRRVEITGAAEPEQIVDVRETSLPLAPRDERLAGTSGSGAQISSLQTTRIEISDLHVRSVQPRGERCTTSG